MIAYVGCYTTPQRRGRGDGIHVFSMDPATGAWTHIQRIEKLTNPSFLIVSRDQRFLYSVHGDERYATTFSIDPVTGFARSLGQANTGGTNGVHQALSRNGKFLVVANYGSGTVAVLPVRPDGMLADFIQLVTLEGPPGPHRVEQVSSHPHHVVFDPSGRFVLVPDKGLDRVFVFHFDDTEGRLRPTEQGSMKARSGAAPRHLAFHPTLPVIWVLNEIGSTTLTCSWDPATGEMRPVQVLSSLPSDFTGDSSGAEIAVTSDGRFVYCSNRGHDSVAIYRTDPKTGLLTSIGWTPTQGKSPRYIGLDPRQQFLYATNEVGDSIATFRVDRATGKLTATGQLIRTGSPVTIAFTEGAMPR